MKVKQNHKQVYYDLEKQQLLEELQEDEESVEGDNVMDESSETQEEGKENIIANKQAEKEFIKQL